MLVLLGRFYVATLPMILSVFISLRDGFFLKFSSASSDRLSANLGGYNLPLFISLSWVKPSLVTSISASNSSVKLSFLKSKLWLMQNLCSYALGGDRSSTCSPNIYLSIHALNLTSASLIQKIFYLRREFSFMASDSYRSFLYNKNAYFYVSPSFSVCLGGMKTSKVFLAGVFFSPTFFFICYLMRAVSTSFFFTQCKICSFLVLSAAMFFLSYSLSLRSCASPLRIFMRMALSSFQRVPICLSCISAALCACSAKLLNLSLSNCSAEMSSFTRPLNCKSFCLCPTSSTKHLRVAQLSFENGRSPICMPHPTSVFLANERCSWKSDQLWRWEREESRESQRVSASCIPESWSAKNGWFIDLNIQWLFEREDTLKKWRLEPNCMKM